MIMFEILMTMNAGDARARPCFLRKLLDFPASFCLLENDMEKKCGWLDDMNEHLKFSEGEIWR